MCRLCWELQPEFQDHDRRAIEDYEVLDGTNVEVQELSLHTLGNMMGYDFKKHQPFVAEAITDGSVCLGATMVIAGLLTRMNLGDGLVISYFRNPGLAPQPIEEIQGRLGYRMLCQCVINDLIVRHRLRLSDEDKQHLVNIIVYQLYLDNPQRCGCIFKPSNDAWDVITNQPKPDTLRAESGFSFSDLPEGS